MRHGTKAGKIEGIAFDQPRVECRRIIDVVVSSISGYEESLISM